MACMQGPRLLRPPDPLEDLRSNGCSAPPACVTEGSPLWLLIVPSPMCPICGQKTLLPVTFPPQASATVQESPNQGPLLPLARHGLSQDNPEPALHAGKSSPWWPPFLGPSLRRQRCTGCTPTPDSPKALSGHFGLVYLLQHQPVRSGSAAVGTLQGRERAREKKKPAGTETGSSERRRREQARARKQRAS